MRGGCCFICWWSSVESVSAILGGKAQSSATVQLISWTAVAMEPGCVTSVSAMPDSKAPHVPVTSTKSASLATTAKLAPVTASANAGIVCASQALATTQTGPMRTAHAHKARAHLSPLMWAHAVDWPFSWSAPGTESVFVANVSAMRVSQQPTFSCRQIVVVTTRYFATSLTTATLVCNVAAQLTFRQGTRDLSLQSVWM